MVAPKRRADIEREALEILRRHGLDNIPIDPVVLANKIGVKVYNAQFSEDVAGMIAKRSGAITLLVRQGDPPYRKRFTIAHELGHHFLHLPSDGEFTDNT